MKKIKTALISVFYKDKLEPIVKKLEDLGVEIYSTGGTQKFIEEAGSKVTAIENLTSYPSILGGRVKTLHPKVFGGILGRRESTTDQMQLAEYEIPEIDLVIVDLYPFEETVANGGSEEDIIEKIDIGGISLIRAGAKNFKDVLVVSSRNQYKHLLEILNSQQGFTNIEDRKSFAREAFSISSQYDTVIFNYFDSDNQASFSVNFHNEKKLRYGENPHQEGFFFGDLNKMFTQLHGKELSYNNLLDIDAAVNLIDEFTDQDPTFVVLKHNNACGVATRNSLLDAWKDALAGDPISAFGGILITNKSIDTQTAEEINKLFCEVVIAPQFENDAIAILKQKKNRILLQRKETASSNKQIRTVLNGVLVQDADTKSETKVDLKVATEKEPSDTEINDLIFANKVAKHTKSNTIVLAKGNQLLASGTGQTSRVDALNQAIEKARKFNFSLEGAVMASDAFFPFPDCVEIAHKAGITAVIQPGGSIKDQESIDYCNKNGISMVLTGTRHFKH